MRLASPDISRWRSAIANQAAGLLSCLAKTVHHPDQSTVAMGRCVIGRHFVGYVPELDEAPHDRAYRVYRAWYASDP